MALLMPQPIHAEGASGHDFVFAARGLRLQQGVAPIHGASLHAEPYKVTPNSPVGMSVLVQPGSAWNMVPVAGFPDSGLFHTFNDANVAVTVNNADGTNPRLDQVFLAITGTPPTYQGTLTYVAGTPTSGATLDNRTGAGSVPPNSIRLADILVPAGASAVNSGDIRDRRPWAYGGFTRLAGAGAAQIAVTTTSSTDIGTATKRLEISSGFVNVSVSAQLTFPASAAGLGIDLGVAWTGAATGSRAMRFTNFGTSAVNKSGCADFDLSLPTPGSYVFRVTGLLTAANGTGVLVNNTPTAPAQDLQVLIREVVNVL